jgi:hypothetical protein
MWFIAPSCWKNVNSATGWRANSGPKKFSNIWT